MSEHARQLRIAIDNLRNTATKRGHDMFARTATEALDALLAEHRSEVEQVHEDWREYKAMKDAEAARLASDAESARDAALEEAAELMEETRRLAAAAADREEQAGAERANGRHNDHYVREMRHSADVLETQAHRIRALKSQPARQYVDVVRVWEVLGSMHDHPTNWDAATCRHAARCLGVDLDASGDDCSRCYHPTQQHDQKGACGADHCLCNGRGRP